MKRLPLVAALLAAGCAMGSGERVEEAAAKARAEEAKAREAKVERQREVRLFEGLEGLWEASQDVKADPALATDPEFQKRLARQADNVRRLLKKKYRDVAAGGLAIAWHVAPGDRARLESKVEQRLARIGIASVRILPADDDQVKMLMGPKEAQTWAGVRDRMLSMGRVEFLLEAGPDAPADAPRRTVVGDGAEISVLAAPVLGPDAIASARGGDTDGRPVVRLKFTPEAASKLAEITAANRGRQLALMIDGECVMAPFLDELVGDEAYVIGWYNDREVRDIGTRIGFGSLPDSARPAGEAPVAPWPDGDPFGGRPGHEAWDAMLDTPLGRIVLEEVVRPRNEELYREILETDTVR